MSMSNSYNRFLTSRYSLPKRSGDLRRLGQLFAAGYAVECANIIERHTNGPVMLIAKDMQNSIQLYEEIQQFTDKKVSILPDWETLPYDSFSPNKAVISARLSNLYYLPLMKNGVIVLPVHTLMQRVCPHEFLSSYTLIINKGQCLSRDEFRHQLEHAGYRSVSRVIAHGEFAMRNTFIELYPMGGGEPCCIDFRDNEIDSIHIFDVEKQRSFTEVDAINLLPGHEFPTNKNAIELFCRKWREKFDVRSHAENVYQKVSAGGWPSGIEYWQPLFFKKPLQSLFSYLPSNTLIINIGNLESAALRFWQEINKRYQNKCIDPTKQVLAPETLWLRVNILFSELKSWPRFVLEAESIPRHSGNKNLEHQALPDLKIHAKNKLPLANLQRFIENFNGCVIFSVQSEGRYEVIQELLGQINIKPFLIKNLNQAKTAGHYIMIGACARGFFDCMRNRALICESDLLGERICSRIEYNRRTLNTDKLICNLAELHPTQPVVHLDHGVGRYVGLVTLVVRGIKSEYLILSYAGEDKLYVPISSLHLISRYSGSVAEKAPLHKLGGDAWTRVKKKAVEQVRDVAAELLDIYAQRTVRIGFHFKKKFEQYQLFCKSFPFETTPDQQQAINSVISDMCQPLAMNRVVCGDVGFGKTEVAARAAFLAVENGKQVAVLVPTTLLAQQHCDNFRNRFATWPICIEMLSRLCSVKAQKQVLHAVSIGKVDIVIGTHKLLDSDICWKDLGLLIIDEEHRFGVRQKEVIKAVCSDVDILTLTATPIPRTLNMAMCGMRDLSIIATPPAHRLAVKTFIREYDSLIVREAILREIHRGGQVYYLFNDVKNIDKAAQKLAELVPEARVAISHGQMRKRDLERVMHDLYRKRFNVLVCTTIIETGIDNANVNTIIIDRADRFGLAQLHQLRGRVGRSPHQAYAYLLVPNPKAISTAAKQRLEAIESLEDLGAGLALATHDLEIRGAGELLGEDQSGQIAAIGFSLYMELLGSVVDALKNGRDTSLEDLSNSKAEVELHIPALLPDDFLPDVNMRLSFYKRIASAKTINDLQELKVELIDRFGVLPQPARNLLQGEALRQHAKTLGIKRIEGNERGGFIEFSDNNCVDPGYLISLLQNNPQIYRLDGPRKLKFMLDLRSCEARMKFTEDLLITFLEHRLTLED